MLIWLLVLIVLVFENDWINRCGKRREFVLFEEIKFILTRNVL